MKKIYSLFAAVLFAITASAQTTIYTENMGTTASGNPLVTAFTGWQNTTPIAYSGTADVRTTGASTGYTGASGSDCIFFAAAGGRTFIVSGINTSAASSSNLQLNFGFSSSQASKNLTVETSIDGGANWSPLVTVSNANTSWALKTVTSGIPANSNLSLRFTGLDASSGGMRIDDVSIINNAGTLAVTDLSTVKGGNFVKNTFVKNDEITFGSAAKDVKVYNMLGQIVKTASVKENESVSVAELQKGNYIVTGTVNNKPVSQKILKD
ncbi:MAG: T9SS type A sorting domain-containing protein [Chlorobi bacterium]|nr:T9SS type A sorting domain-containing protein [Chlorobiota bacterium]